MSNDDHEERDDRRDRRRDRPRLPKRSRLPRILGGVAVGLMLFCCAASAVGYLMFGSTTVTDPQRVEAARDRHASLDIPPELSPRSFNVQITGYETIRYESASGRSFIRLGTGS